MRALAGELLLKAWEDGLGEPELRRPLALLSAALPDRDPAELASLPLGERNRLLLRVHELSFGPVLTAVTTCSGCHEPLEFSVPVSELAEMWAAQSGEGALEWREDDRRYELRPVTTADLIATVSIEDAGVAQELLLSRCLRIAPPRDTDEALLATPSVLAKFEELHGATELTCTVACPSCSKQDFADLDIARFVWAEVRREASRLLGEVHTLASHYGWSERTILDLDARRRFAYLELVEG